MLSSSSAAGNLRNLLERILGLTAHELVPLTRRASWFLQSLPWLSAVALLTGMQEMTASQKQIANFAFAHLRFLETHRSLLHFKQKFQPCWESRYMAVSTTLALPKIALALLRVHQS